MPMAFDKRVLERSPAARVVVVTAVLGLMAVFAIVHLTHQPQHTLNYSPRPIEELPQTSLRTTSGVAAGVMAGMRMPPLPKLNLPPLPKLKEEATEPKLPGLKLLKQGEKATEALRMNLGDDGEEQDPNPANQGLRDLATHIAAKDPLPLMPQPPQMPPIATEKAATEDHSEDAGAAHQVGAKHPHSTVDAAEKVLSRAQASLKVAKSTKPTAASLTPTGAKPTATAVADTVDDPTCCSKWNQQGGAHYVVRKDKCDEWKHCHGRCGTGCYCCTRNI